MLGVSATGAPAAVVLRDCTRPPTHAHIVVTELATMDLYWALSFQNRCTSFSESLARFFFRQLLCAIEFLHSCGLYHLDIKVENILIFNCDGQFSLRLTDFGRMVRTGSAVPVVRCKEDYEPPERCHATSASVLDGEKVDIWQTAVVLLYMLAASEHKIWR